MWHFARPPERFSLYRMIRAAILSLALILAGCTSVRGYGPQGYAIPADRDMRIVVMRPDVEVGLLNAGGVIEPRVDWTEEAQTNLLSGLAANLSERGASMVLLPDQQGDAARLVADYERLHMAVAMSIAEFRYGSERLPTKGEEGFDWTLGPGAARIGELGGGNYALFLTARDSFSSDERVALQVLGWAGCLIGLCFAPSGGQRFAYVSLVELETGDIVWFNILSSSVGDIRSPEGARSTVDSLLREMPTRAGEADAS